MQNGIVDGDKDVDMPSVYNVDLSYQTNLYSVSFFWGGGLIRVDREKTEGRAKLTVHR